MKTTHTGWDPTHDKGKVRYSLPLCDLEPVHQSEVPRGNRNTRPEAQGHDIKGHSDPRMGNSKEQSHV